MSRARVFNAGWPLLGGDTARKRAIRQLEAMASIIEPAKQRVTELDADTLSWQLKLARIPSPTGSEWDRASAVMGGLSACNWRDVRRDSAGNVIARIGGVGAHANSNAPIVCMAHLDTVFPLATTLEPVIEGSRITCPGIGDNSRGLAAIMTLASVLGAANGPIATAALNRPIELVATVGEEGLGNLRGAQSYFAARLNAGVEEPHAVVVLDGPGDSRIVHHALGSRRYRVNFRGAGGHSWADFGNPNAVHAAGRATGWLAELPRAIGGRIALTVSGIGGGESVNSIPTHAWLDIDLRGTDQILVQRGEVEIRRIVQAAAAIESQSRGEALSLTYDIELLGERPCGALEKDHPLVAIAQAATIAEGLEPVSAIASTDANIPLSLGIPAITIGAGGTGGGAHTLHEWYDNLNATRGMARAIAIVLALAA